MASNQEHNTTNGSMNSGMNRRTEDGHNNTISSDLFNRLRNAPGFDPRPLKVAVVGAGASGLCLAYKVLDGMKKGTLKSIDFTVYEKLDDYTGTWHANRYPGCRCDVPSHVYQFTFAPYADWPHYFSSAAAIKEYMQLFAQKFDIPKHIRLKHTVTAAIYEESTAKWHITVEDAVSGTSFTDVVDVFVPATGILSNVNRPKIPGLDTFTKKPILHTAEWPADLKWEEEFKDDKVAVIGVGSSGVQTIGAIAPYTKSLDIYARSKFWVTPPVNYEVMTGRPWELDNFVYSEEERKSFRENPEAFYEHLMFVNRPMNVFYEYYKKGSAVGAQGKEMIKKFMVDTLKREDLIAKIIPEYGVGCRRIAPSASFLAGVQLPHVNLITEGIKTVTPTSIITEDGQERSVDRIILATGFDTSFRPAYNLRGRNGLSLSDLWAKRPKAYISVAVHGFPNMFLMGCGPTVNYAHGSVLLGSDVNAEYIVKALAKMQRQDIRSMEPDLQAQNDYNDVWEVMMEDRVWTDSCSSWYKAGTTDGKPDALYPGSALQYLELLSEPRWEDWKYTYRYSNRFSFLGNGTSTIENTGGELAPYIKMEHIKENTISNPRAVDNTP
ncbi:cyclohexanone monooxygenase [Dendrothele bispora CBS 962.96]|uniref:Cyclohexanone monooxygenase n=1 Tax=Dendrothele bispora (strain CBS 962.96) TaxID=1314807 RepID=A0A4S8MMF1_DENBC|nr:cyclohexanone monooxygenase [Dendrothele bispora CBS 962.96]